LFVRPYWDNDNGPCNVKKCSLKIYTRLTDGPLNGDNNRPTNRPAASLSWLRYRRLVSGFPHSVDVPEIALAAGRLSPTHLEVGCHSWRLYRALKLCHCTNRL
jgi:hypothetical protein